MESINLINLTRDLSDPMNSLDSQYVNTAVYEVNEIIYSLNDYLPLLYKDESESEYIKTLFKALEISYSNALYQFAYIQLHMIFMVCIYYILIKINVLVPKDIENALHYMIKDRSRVKDFYGLSNTRDGELYFGSFAVLGESDVFLLLKIAGIDADLQGELKKLVEERNKYAHANGNITITSQTTIDDKISKYINTLERVQRLVKPIIEGLYRKTLINPDFYDPEERLGYLDDSEQIREEFIKKHSLSSKDVNICRKFNIAELSELEGYIAIRNLHIALCEFYKSYSNDEIAESCVQGV
ncbi:MAG TPA: hypothetical protein VFC64_00580 [Atopostipes sp.]|nr:hypothetical protein [Atopostipes sp.]